MNIRELKRRLAPYQGYMKPAGGDGDDTGGDTTTADRGDSWTPTDEDPKDAARKLAAEEGGDGKGGEDEDADDSSAKKETKAGEKTGEDDKAKPKIIPLDRHEKILARERAQREELQRQLDGLQGQARVEKTNEQISKLETQVAEKDAEYAKLLADGETKKAAELMKEIRGLERQIIETKAEFKAQAATAIAVEQMRYDTALERIEAAYPKLNPDGDEFDEELMADVVDLKAVYQRRGDTPTKALQKAVTKLLGKPETAAQENATTVTPRVSEEDLAKQRKAGAAKTTADAARRTPPNTSKIGQDSDKMGGGLNAKDVMNLPQDEFAKLSEEALSKLRGDTL